MNHYDTLGVAPGASAEEIKNAYRLQIKCFHPDVFDGPPAVARLRCTALNEAYSVLKDLEKRREYDFQLARGSMDAQRGMQPQPRRQAPCERFTWEEFAPENDPEPIKTYQTPVWPVWDDEPFEPVDVKEVKDVEDDTGASRETVPTPSPGYDPTYPEDDSPAPAHAHTLPEDNPAPTPNSVTPTAPTRRRRALFLGIALLSLQVCVLLLTLRGGGIPSSLLHLIVLLSPGIVGLGCLVSGRRR